MPLCYAELIQVGTLPGCVSEISPCLGRMRNNFTSSSIWPSTAPNVPMRSPGAVPGFPAVAEGSGNAEGHWKRRGAGTPWT